MPWSVSSGFTRSDVDAHRALPILKSLPESVSESFTPTRMNAVAESLKHRHAGRLLLVIYLLSGGAALAYEILWSRMLALLFGVSIFGVVITVASFMFGLGAGALLGRRWLVNSRQPLRLFALLEFLVALSALLLPTLFRLLEAELGSLAASLGWSAWYTLEFSVVAAVLILPALAMGAGFPMVLAVAERSGLDLGRLYGMNALGGALGALAPLALLPAFGWLAALFCMAVISLLTAMGALLLSQRLLSEVRHAQPAPQRPALRWLLIYAVIGLAALLLEIGWTRLMGMVLLRTEYVLAVILATFLLGIGLGSIIARHLRAQIWLAILPVVASGMVVAGLWCFPSLAAWAETTEFSSLAQALLLQGTVIALFTLPVTLVLGAWLPLFAACLGDERDAGVWLYGANSIGAAAGTLLAGFVLIPAIGTPATIVSGALLLLICGLLWTDARRWSWTIIVIAAAALPVLDMPAVNRLLPGAYGDARLLSLREDAIAITHVVERADGQRQLLADLRRMDASSDPTAVVAQMNQTRLPLLLHPQPASVLFLGLGTGISAAGSVSYPGLERTAVEISQGAIDAAATAFAPVNHHILERLQVVRDDARHFLQRDTGSYDVIIGDLFHPDLAGRSAMLSVQQFQRARARLSADGVFVQWLALNQFDLHSLQVILQSFKAVFPGAVIFVDAFRLALVGTNQTGFTADAMLHNVQRLDAATLADVTGGEGLWTWAGRYWGTIPDSAVSVQDEWAPVIEYRLPQARFNGDLDLSRLLQWLLAIRPDAAAAAQSLALPEALLPEFASAYTATTLAQQSWLALLTGQSSHARQLLPRAYQANPQDRWIGFALADAVLADRHAAQARGLNDQQLFAAVLKIRPDHPEALRGLWHSYRDAGVTAQAEEYRARLAAVSPLDREAARHDVRHE